MCITITHHFIRFVNLYIIRQSKGGIVLTYIADGGVHNNNMNQKGLWRDLSVKW